MISLVLIATLGTACTSPQSVIPGASSLQERYLPPSAAGDVGNGLAHEQQAIDNLTAVIVSDTKEIKGPIARSDFLISAYCESLKQYNGSDQPEDQARTSHTIRAQAIENAYEQLAAQDQVDTIDSFVLAAYNACPQYVQRPYEIS